MQEAEIVDESEKSSNYMTTWPNEKTKQTNSENNDESTTNIATTRSTSTTASEFPTVLHGSPIPYNSSLSSSSVDTDTDCQTCANWRRNILDDTVEDIEFEEKILIHTSTWNMQGGFYTEGLGDYLVPYTHHVYVVGTQETERSLQSSLLNESKEHWTAAVKLWLGSKYEMVHSETLLGLHLMILVRKDLIKHIRNTVGGKIPLSLGGTLGNKGAVAIGLCFGRTSILFINAHLPAHQSEIESRNSAARKIWTNLSSSTMIGDPEEWDHVIWLGDLNYRVEGVRKALDWAISHDMLEVLLANEQLSAERKKEDSIWNGFSEGMLSFRPTYKFEPGTDNYDTSPKQRCPSWTDRILFRSYSNRTNEENDLRLLSYNSIPSVRHSDHRPVYARFEVKVQLDVVIGDRHPNRRNNNLNYQQSRTCLIM
eukprot:gb/GECH01014428.1/.p1 GENE.gb/GECH01014428.1/~~gb/GECH01014428.1/.p1  ORF type:complete len:425 (+),score=93.33 gb/GECH01014428.1/:1-1275(+)